MSKRFQQLITVQNGFKIELVVIILIKFLYGVQARLEKLEKRIS